MGGTGVSGFTRKKQEVCNMDKELVRAQLEKVRVAGEDYEAAALCFADDCSRLAEILDSAPEVIGEIDAQFENATGLHGRDIAFLFTAASLQCVRQYVLNRIMRRTDHNKSDKFWHGLQDKILPKDADASSHGRFYYATKAEILRSYSVPYDVTKGTKKYNVSGIGSGLGGEHRLKTLGHDPLLGLVFGTSNIMTNTLTNTSAVTFHVKKGKVISHGGWDKTALMFEHVAARTKDEPEILAYSLVKQILHIGSDMYSKNGIVIPGGLSMDSEFIKTLTDYGIDFGNIMKVSSDASLAMLINYLTAMLHRLTYDVTKDGDSKLFEVRTRRIVLYADCIASGLNALVCAGGVGAGYILGSDAMVKESLESIDIGGLLVTISRLFSDPKYIKKIKQEFILQHWTDYINEGFSN